MTNDSNYPKYTAEIWAELNRLNQLAQKHVEEDVAANAKPATMTLIKDHLVEAYRAAGVDFMTACQLATEFMRNLKREKPGTIWSITRPDGKIIAVRRN